MTARRGGSGVFGRFVLVGGSLSLGFSVTTSALINLAGTPPLATAVIVYLACIPIGFAAQKRLAFAVEKTRSSAMALYTATQIGSLAVVSAVTTAFVQHDLWRDTLLMLFTAGVAAIVSFAIGRYLTFRPA